MGRSLRPQIDGGLYHVTARGNRRQPIYHTDVDHQLFLRLFGSVVKQCGWCAHAYCLMPNHYHLVFATPVGNISRGMHRLNSVYARWFNERHSLDGHLFQGRFDAEIVASQEHLLEVARYVVLNPVRAGLCPAASEWQWSSFRAMAGMERPEPFLALDWLMSQFGLSRASALVAFRAFVADGVVVGRAGA